MMKEWSNTRKWLTCGALVLVSGCIGAVVALGGVTALLAYLGLTMEETATPDTAYNPLITDAPAVSMELPEPPSEQPLYRAVVQIVTFYTENNDLEIGWTGSGSIITPDGFILTNAHVVLPDKYFPVDALGVSITEREDQAPVLTYYAEVVQAEESLDIAVIRITRDIDGNPVDPANLDLPYVAMGDADELHLGDSITILGYPGIGGETVTLTRGEVSGFTSEQGRGDRAFIKTSATIAGGNSGGLAADGEGKLIGIPTQLGYGGEDQFVDCRTLADTNRDGVVDDRDSCVPTGGFINALRPINLALPMIEAARQGHVSVAENPPALPDEDIPDQGSVLYQDDFSNPNSGWPEGEDDEVSHGYVSGEYHIEVDVNDTFTWATSYDSYGDVIIDVDTRVVTSSGDGDYGIVCRYQDRDNFYGLEVSEDDYITIWKFVEGEYFSLIDWVYSDYIAKIGEDLHITAGCVGDKLTLAVNGALLAEARDSDLSTGDVGIVVGTYENPGVVVGFDNFKVSSPSP
ncbi:MAG: serine protease [Anaerolineales bacterium]|jgi:S1-C subfamily serine protease